MYGARLDVADGDETGFHETNKELKKGDPAVTWTINGATLPAGKYAVEMTAALLWNDHGDRCFHNMAKSGEETRNQYQDTVENDDFRYFVKVNGGAAINPTQRKAWGQGGLGMTQKNSDHTNAVTFNFVNEFTTTEAITSFSLEHAANIGFELIIYSVRLVNLDKAAIEVAEPVDESTPRSIVFGENGITKTGLGTSIANGVVTINKAGSYTVSGTATEGQIIVDESVANEDVEIILHGLNLSWTGMSAPIWAKHSGLLKLKKDKDTTNIITDGRAKANEGGCEYAVTAAGSVNVVGKGTLTINANYKSGIGAEGAIGLKNGTLTVTGKNKALYSHTAIELGHATDKGVINLEGKSKVAMEVELTAETIAEGAKTGIIVNDGTYNIKGAKKGMKSGVATGNDANRDHATIAFNAGSGTITALGADEDAVKAQGNVTLAGGEFTFKAETAPDPVADTKGSDGLDVEGNIYVTGGSYTVSATVDGIHSDKTLSITGGTINVTQSEEGLEALDIEISGGNITVVSEDDAINAGGGSDAELTDDAWDAIEGTAEYAPMIHIFNSEVEEEGGSQAVIPTINVYAKGDGIDSNGDINIEGGMLFIEQEGAGNCPIDFHAPHNYTQNGGAVIAIGSAEHLALPTAGNSYTLAAQTPEVTTAGVIGFTIVMPGDEPLTTTYFAQPKHATVESIYFAGAFDANTTYEVFTVATATPTGQGIAFLTYAATFDAEAKVAVTSGTFTSTNKNVVYTPVVE